MCNVASDRLSHFSTIPKERIDCSWNGASWNLFWEPVYSCLKGKHIIACYYHVFFLSWFHGTHQLWLPWMHVGCSTIDFISLVFYLGKITFNVWRPGLTVFFSTLNDGGRAWINMSTSVMPNARIWCSLFSKATYVKSPLTLLGSHILHSLSHRLNFGVSKVPLFSFLWLSSSWCLVLDLLPLLAHLDIFLSPIFWRPFSLLATLIH